MDNLPQKTRAGLVSKLRHLFSKHNKTPLQEAQAPQTDPAQETVLRMLTLKQVPVSDFMIPRPDITWLEATMSFEEVLEIVGKHPFDRFPVCQEKLDNILGMVSTAQLLQRSQDGERFILKRNLTKPLFIPPSMLDLDLLMKMLDQNRRFALVMDEYGGVDGLVTITDVIRQITGITEESLDESIEPKIVEHTAHSFDADGRVDIEEFEERFDIQVAQHIKDEVDTLAGLVTYLAGFVPKRGALVKFNESLMFEVLESDPRKIRKIRIRHTPQKA